MPPVNIHTEGTPSLKEVWSGEVGNPGKNWSLCTCAEIEAWIKAVSLWN